MEEKTLSTWQVLILPVLLSRYNPSTLGCLIYLLSQKNLWNLQMAQTDSIPMWKFPVFLNHAEKTVQLAALKTYVSLP